MLPIGEMLLQGPFGMPQVLCSPSAQVNTWGISQGTECVATSSPSASVHVAVELSQPAPTAVTIL